MAARSIVILLMMTMLLPMVTAQSSEAIDYGFGAELSDNPEDAPPYLQFLPSS